MQMYHKGLFFPMLIGRRGKPHFIFECMQYVDTELEKVCVCQVLRFRVTSPTNQLGGASVGWQAPLYHFKEEPSPVLTLESFASCHWLSSFFKCFSSMFLIKVFEFIYNLNLANTVF